VTTKINEKRMLFLANTLLRKQKTVNDKLMNLGKQIILCMLMIFPAALISQSNDSTSTVNTSPFEIDLSVFGHSLFGDGIGTLPGKTSIGIGYDGALKYRMGNVGLALSGGFWKANYDPVASGVTFTQRLDAISAHYIMFGPFLTVGEGKVQFEINPKVGVQRFYFPHFTGRSSTGQVVQRVRTDFDAGITAGLGVKGRWKLDNDISLHLRVDYLSTLSDEAFKYRYTTPSGTTTNTNPLQSLSFGAGASLALKSKSTNDSSKSFAPTALDIAAGAGLNFLIGKGIDNLPGEKSAGYDADLTLNYRIGRSGIALSGGFWDNKYDAKSPTTVGMVTQRLDNISAHYISAGPIIPVTSKTSKIRLEAVPHVGIQRIYFPHSSLVSGGSVVRRVTTNLEAGWSAGLGLNLMIPIDPKLDLKIGADYTSMLTDRGFGFTVRQSNPVVNRTPLERINVGVGVAYNILQKVTAADDEMTPEKIAEMIDAKEDDMEKTDTENKDGIDMQVGGDKDPMDKPKEEVDTTIETVPQTNQPTVTEETEVPAATDPAVTNPPSTTPAIPSPVITEPSTSDVSSSSNTVYRVQFVALSKDVKVFNQLKQYGTVILEYYAAKGLYRYMVGDANTREEGLELLNRIHRNGWPKAFLVKYENGIRTRVR